MEDVSCVCVDGGCELCVCVLMEDVSCVCVCVLIVDVSCVCWWRMWVVCVCVDGGCELCVCVDGGCELCECVLICVYLCVQRLWPPVAGLHGERLYRARLDCSGAARCSRLSELHQRARALRGRPEEEEHAQSCPSDPDPYSRPEEPDSSTERPPRSWSSGTGWAPSANKEIHTWDVNILYTISYYINIWVSRKLWSKLNFCTKVQIQTYKKNYERTKI